MQQGKIALSIVALILVLALAATASEINVSRVADDGRTPAPPAAPPGAVMVQSPQAAYSGSIRIYVVERFSRYLNSDGVPHDNGFLDFAAVDNFTIADGETFEVNVAWDATPFSGVLPARMRAMAIVASDDTFQGDADPPANRIFWGNQVDAAASAFVGDPGFNETGPGFTHTLFIEEGSATW